MFKKMASRDLNEKKVEVNNTSQRLININHKDESHFLLAVATCDQLHSIPVRYNECHSRCTHVTTYQAIHDTGVFLSCLTLKFLSANIFITVLALTSLLSLRNYVFGCACVCMSTILSAIFILWVVF